MDAGSGGLYEAYINAVRIDLVETAWRSGGCYVRGKLPILHSGKHVQVVQSDIGLEDITNIDHKKVMARIDRRLTIDRLTGRRTMDELETRLQRRLWEQRMTRLPWRLERALEPSPIPRFDAWGVNDGHTVPYTPPSTPSVTVFTSMTEIAYQGYRILSNRRSARGRLEQQPYPAHTQAGLNIMEAREQDLNLAQAGLALGLALPDVMRAIAFIANLVGERDGARAHIHNQPVSAAEKRARELIKDTLPQSVVDEYLSKGYALVTTPAGNTYELHAGSCYLRDAQGNNILHLCIISRISCPETDTFFGRYLLLVNNEEEFLHIAIPSQTKEKAFRAWYGWKLAMDPDNPVVARMKANMDFSVRIHDEESRLRHDLEANHGIVVVPGDAYGTYPPPAA